MVKPIVAGLAPVAQLPGISPACHAGSNTGFDYTHVGHDPTTPIFPNDRSPAPHKNGDNCLIDCKPGANVITPDATPGMGRRQ